MASAPFSTAALAQSQSPAGARSSGREGTCGEMATPPAMVELVSMPGIQQSDMITGRSGETTNNWRRKNKFELGKQSKGGHLSPALSPGGGEGDGSGLRTCQGYTAFRG